MKQIIMKTRILILAILICLISSINVEAKDGIESAGDVLAYLMPATAAGITAIKKDWEGSLQFGESFAVAFGTTQAMKHMISEERPDHSDHHSFPSGHTSSAFSSAEFLRKRYGWDYGIPAYAAATFVAFSRVEAKKHYFADVLVGAGIGYLSSHFLADPYKDKTQVQLSVDRDFYGVRISRSW